MVFVLLCGLLLLAWSSGAIQLHARAGVLRHLPLWLAIAWTLTIVAVLGWGAWGLVDHGGWNSLSTGQALHRVLGEGNVFLRRAEWPALNRGAGVYLTLDLVWTLVAACAAQFHGFVFWSERAERRRQAHVRRRH